MMKNKLNDLINQFISEKSEEELISYLENIVADNKQYVLTIIADRTVHSIPDNLLIGEVYDFSRGSIDASSDKNVEEYIVNLLKKLTITLKHKKWTEVRLIYSGHALLASQIKMLVYRILHIDTVDVAHFGRDGYRTVYINMRSRIF